MTTTDEMLQEAQRPARRVRGLTIFGVVVVVLFAGLVLYLKIGADGYYVLSPGEAPLVTASPDCRSAGGGSFALKDGRPCVQLVVPAGQAHQTTGSIMMVDVFEGKPNPWEYLLYRVHLLNVFENGAQFVPNKYIIGNGSPQQLSCQNTQQAVQATSAAPVAALRRLGYKVGEVDLGAQIDTVVPRTAAAAAGLQCNDLVTDINGHAVRNAGDVASALKGLGPGSEARITVTRTGSGGSSKTLVLTARLTGTPALAGNPPEPKKGFLGVVSETRTRYDLPFPVSAQVGSIGGPSDGLALALGFMDTLSEGHLTGGLHIAATGAIDTDGNVIEIGGAAQKAIAVRRAGAQAFFVPVANYADARSKAGSMKVFAVSTLDQALKDLQSLGGQIPPSTGGSSPTTAGRV